MSALHMQVHSVMADDIALISPTIYGLKKMLKFVNHLQ